ncbi:bacterioferritin [Cellvibrio sp. PSBB006]|uniref:ferritin-like domain-containing protein n=1 Tax=Cellvibrio sp. PSBB006 TaxID=1987723 RepID=UPI000B574182|nr:ferritin-like domain-containing protein [Cellvibrio sp. PSBB006]ARU28030.1 bacterioferritin [Cellvibrio sp. PSBB006]
MMNENFSFTDVATLREQARAHTEDGAVTAGYRLDRERLLQLLNEALATELVCTMRYRRHHFVAHGLRAQSVAEEFMVHANQELAHADQIAARIVQLGGEPDFSPATLQARSHAEYVEGETLQDMIRENLVAERIAIESYRELIQYIGDADPTTRRMLEDILAVEEEHADELADWLPPKGSALD